MDSLIRLWEDRTAAEKEQAAQLAEERVLQYVDLHTRSLSLSTRLVYLSIGLHSQCSRASCARRAYSMCKYGKLDIPFTLADNSFPNVRRLSHILFLPYPSSRLPCNTYSVRADVFLYREQELSNCVAQGKLTRALFLGLQLEQPQRLLRILKDLTTATQTADLAVAVAELSDAHMVRS